MFPCKTTELCKISNGNHNASPAYPPLASAGVMFCELFKSYWKVIVRSQHEYEEKEQKSFSNFSKLLFQLTHRKEKKNTWKSLNNYWQVNDLDLDHQSIPRYTLSLANRNILTMLVIMKMISSYWLWWMALDILFLTLQSNGRNITLNWW